MNGKVTTEILTLERRTNTPSGNPRWRIVTPEGAYITGADYDCANHLSEHNIGDTVTLYFKGNYVVLIDNHGNLEEVLNP